MESVTQLVDELISKLNNNKGHQMKSVAQLEEWRNND